MQSAGALEAQLQCRRPDWQLTVRNLGWSGDDVHGTARKRFDGPADGFQRLLSDVETADPTVVLVAYGFSEASDGASAAERFAPGLKHLVQQLQAQSRRVILLPPLASPATASPITGRRWRNAARSFAKPASRRRHRFFPCRGVATEAELTEDQLLPNAQGYGKIAELIGARVSWG